MYHKFPVTSVSGLSSSRCEYSSVMKTKVLFNLSGAQVLKTAAFRTAASEGCRPAECFSSRWDINSLGIHPGDRASGSPKSAVQYSLSLPESVWQHHLAGKKMAKTFSSEGKTNPYRWRLLCEGAAKAAGRKVPQRGPGREGGSLWQPLGSGSSCFFPRCY